MAGVAQGQNVHLNAVAGTLANMGAELNIAALNFKPTLTSINVYLRSQATLRFANQVDPDGKPWAKLKRPRNRKRDKRRNKRADGTAQGGQKVLWDKGLLAASMGARSRKPDIYIVAALWAEQGSNLDYAGFHQKGTRHMVARKIAGINDSDADWIENAVADGAEQMVLKKMGF